MSQKDLLRVYEAYLGKITPFLETLSSEAIDTDVEYLPGKQRIDFYPEQLQFADRIIPEDHSPIQRRPNEYEEALYERITERRDFDVLILLGGLGAGKSTTARLVKGWIDSREQNGSNACGCKRRPCLRTALIIDCSKYEMPIGKQQVVREVMNDIRLGIYGQIIGEWLKTQGIDANAVRDQLDPNLRVLRRLLLRNDFLNFIDADERLYADFTKVKLDLDTAASLLEMRVVLHDIKRLVASHRSSVGDLDDAIRAVVGRKRSSQRFLADVLRFYVSLCDPENPKNTIFVDNLDQLPTGHIEALVRALATVARKARGVPFVVPLRPSSIVGKEFTKRSAARYHYSPNNFELILRRLEERVFRRSREELQDLAKASGGVSLEETEMDALLLCLYTYALILVSGFKSSDEAEPYLQSLLHKDHEFLKGISVAPGALRELASTLDALVGRCCRYALEQLQLYCHNFYTLPSIFHGTATALRQKEHRRLTVRYGKMSYLLLAESRHDVQLPRVANLFLPVGRQDPDAWPTLAKLRILYALKDNPRLSVRYLCERLGRYGIPAEVVISNLNSLHKKYRLLVWFSKNRDLRANKKRDLEQDVVISEHGLRYISEVVCNFEYIWSCATEMWETRDFAFNMSFPEKLDIYLKLLDRIGETEWKQLAFRRFRANALPSQEGVIEFEGMLVLNILYGSLGSILASSEIAVNLKWVSPEHRETTTLLVEGILDRIGHWQARYRVAFGGTGYLGRYRGVLTSLVVRLGVLLREGVLPPEIQVKIKKYLKKWGEDARSINRNEPAGHRELRSPDSVTKLARIGLSFPGVGPAMEPQHKAEAVSVYRKQLARLLTRLEFLLGERLPSYGDIVQYLKLVVVNLRRLSAVGEKQAAVGRSEFESTVQLEQELGQGLNTLQRFAYRVPARCSSREMSEIKRRYNGVVGVVADLASRGGGLPEWYENLQWVSFERGEHHLE